MQDPVCFARNCVLCKIQCVLQETVCYARSSMFCKKLCVLQDPVCFTRNCVLCQIQYVLQETVCYARSSVFYKKLCVMQDPVCWQFLHCHDIHIVFIHWLVCVCCVLRACVVCWLLFLYCSQPSSSTWAQSGEEVVLSSWEVESPHRYLNNQDIHKVGAGFYCAVLVCNKCLADCTVR